MGGDRGAGARENRGREGYGRRERKGREAGVPKGREAGEIGENYITLHNISQSKKGKREEAKKNGAGAGIARYVRREVWTPLSPPKGGGRETVEKLSSPGLCNYFECPSVIRKSKQIVQ